MQRRTVDAESARSRERRAGKNDADVGVAVVIILVLVILVAIARARVHHAARSGIARDAKGSGNSGFLIIGPVVVSGLVVVSRGEYAVVVDDAIANRPGYG